jgi:hypothetical protein
MRFLAATLVVFAVVPAAPAINERPRVWLVDVSPLVVGGARFQPREHVRVTYSSKTSRSKTVIATAAGRFRASFATTLGACEPYAITAVGDRGSRAIMKFMPECPPIQP